MDLRQLAYVVAVVDEGGFTRAAEALGVAQPSLSQGVRSLEAELGVELFHRTGRGVVPSAAGEALLPPARQALRDAATARAAVAAVVGLTGGHLDLVCLPTLAVTPTAALVGGFRRAHPAVTVRLVEPEDAGDVAATIRSGGAEVGVTELPAPADLVAVELDAHEYLAVLPPGDARAGRDHLRLADLAGAPLITTPPGTSTRRVVDEAFAAAGVVPTVGVETDHREVVVPLVLAGAGASLLPGPMAADAAERGAVVRPVRPAPRRRIGLVHRDGPLSPAAAAFVALAVPEAAPRHRRPSPRRRPG